MLRKLELLVFAGLLGGAVAANASTISINGTFTQDDDVQWFFYTVQAPGYVTVFTTSYATGGFETSLTVADSTHNILYTDTGYGADRDSSITWNSDAGELYIVALTQYANDSFGPGFSLDDGFALAGTGNYTAEPPFNVVPGGSFLMPGGEQRTSDWAVNFTAADPAGLNAYAPEPSTFGLFGAGTAFFLLWRRRVRA